MKDMEGFTLVELIVTIVILGLIVGISFPILSNVVENSKKKILLENIKIIEEAAYKYSISNDLGFDLFEKKINLEELKKEGYLSNKIINPITNDDMKGCLTYRWNVNFNNYDIKYIEDCSIYTLDEIIQKNYADLLDLNINGCSKSSSSNYSYMGGCYLKGQQTNNYVWFSGFLWRIMGRNSDGSIKLITNDSVTGIPFGAPNYGLKWNESHVKSWLNDYFYKKINGLEIIKNQDWCSNTISTDNSVRTECTKERLFKSDVGLITLDEYNLSGGKESYLNNKQYQWTMTPDSNAYVWRINSDGTTASNGTRHLQAIRPIINVQSDSLLTSGNGLLEDIAKNSGPYVLNDFKINNFEKITMDNVNCGEYVEFSNNLYRVVDKNKNGIKLILDGFYKENDKYFLTKFGTSNIFSISDGIGKKLNGDILKWIAPNENEREKIALNAEWFQNSFSHGQNYIESIKNNYDNKIENNIVGLPVIGELLTSPTHYEYNVSLFFWGEYWTMNKTIDDNWAGSNSSTYGLGNRDSEFGIRPVIYIKPSVNIKTGTGIFNNPYQI